MRRSISIATILTMTLLGHFIGAANADEIVIGNRPHQRSLSELGMEMADGGSENSRLITAGELWQFFHNQGVTSVDRLTLNLECGDIAPNTLGAIRFQIEDPSNGSILTHLSINPETHKLEVPLEFDYMKRFSPGSKELIRLDLSDLDSLGQGATVSIDSENSYFGPFNLILVVGFMSFWIAVFFVLNRFTKPIAQEEAEDIVVVSTNGEKVVAETIVTQTPANNANRGQSIVVASSNSRSGHSKMVSAQ